MTDLGHLRDQGKFAIWLACRPPERSFKEDYRASTSRAALFRALGGPLSPLSVETILLRSGLATGVLRLPDQSRKPPAECNSSDASTASERVQF